MNANHLVGSACTLLAVCMLASCGTEQLSFESDKNPAGGTITLVQSSRAPTEHGGVAFVDAMVTDAPPIIGANFFFRFRHGRVGVIDVELGSFFPEGGQETVPARPEGLLTWRVRQLDAAESLLEITIAQDEKAGVVITTPGIVSLFTIGFYATASGASETELVVDPMTTVVDRDGKPLFNTATIRAGRLVSR